jgi:hypothetical protein
MWRAAEDKSLPEPGAEAKAAAKKAAKKKPKKRPKVTRAR